jgi:hypothetical protein
MKKFQLTLLAAMLLLAGCGKQAQATLAPVATAISATATLIPTDTPAPTQDPTVFGAIGMGEVQAGAIESVASAIFNKILDQFMAAGSVQEYQIISLTVFPGGDGLIAEIIYSVKSADPVWLADGGVQLADGWIANGCSRFDFFTTETEYQLKNRRLCS